MARTGKTYFDDEGKQTRALPRKWMDAIGHFKVGDRIEYLGDVRVHIPCAECLEKSWYHHNGHQGDCETRPLKGQIGTIEKVTNGYGIFPPRWLPPEGDNDEGCW